MNQLELIESEVVALNPPRRFIGCENRAKPVPAFGTIDTRIVEP